VQQLQVWPGVRCKNTVLCCHQLVRRREKNMEHAGHVAQLIAFAQGLQRRCRPDDALRSDREVRGATDCSNQMAGCDGDKGSIVRNNSGIVNCAVMYAVAEQGAVPPCKEHCPASVLSVTARLVLRSGCAK
jgi:hypothetical protein